MTPDLAILVAACHDLGGHAYAVNVSILTDRVGYVTIHAEEIPAWLDGPPERVLQYADQDFTSAIWATQGCEVHVILRPAQPDLAPASPTESSEGGAGSEAVGAVGESP